MNGEQLWVIDIQMHSVNFVNIVHSGITANVRDRTRRPPWPQSIRTDSFLPAILGLLSCPRNPRIHKILLRMSVWPLTSKFFDAQRTSDVGVRGTDKQMMLNSVQISKEDRRSSEKHQCSTVSCWLCPQQTGFQDGGLFIGVPK